MPDEPTTLESLLGDPVNARDTITTALVQPEVLAALLKAMDEQESPVEAADPLATAVLESADKRFRKKIGPLPWVRKAPPGPVTAVHPPTCTVAVPGIDQPVTDVLYGPTPPAVGDSYPVRFPVALPPEGIALARGPVPFGQPWIKVAGGVISLYYRAFESEATGWALFRAPLPPPEDPTFTYDPDTVLRVHSLPTGPLTGNINLGGATLDGSYFWLDEHAFERFARPELAPASYPYNTRLHRYDAFGSEQTETLLDTSPVHVMGHGTNRGPTVADDLLGSSWYSVAITPPAGWPGAGPYYDVVLDLVVSHGGTLWLPVSTGIVIRKHVFVKTADGSWITDRVIRSDPTSPLDATGWVADSDLAGWWLDGQRVQLWALTTWANGDPYPDRTIIGSTDPAADNPVKALLYVSADGGPALPHPLSQPAGWVRAFMLRPTGGATARAWWLGSETNGGTAHLWRGEGTLGGAWTWAIKDGGLGLDALRAVSADASVVLAGKNAGFPTFDEVRYLSQDAGEHWTALPDLPHTELMGGTAPQAWLVDTP